jgi:flagellar biosynthesis chaperone FliJ
MRILTSFLTICLFSLSTAQTQQEFFTYLSNMNEMLLSGLHSFESSYKCAESLPFLESYQLSTEANYNQALNKSTEISHTVEEQSSKLDALNAEVEYKKQHLTALQKIRCEETTLFLQWLKDSKEIVDMIRFIQIDVDKFYRSQKLSFDDIGLKLKEMIGTNIDEAKLRSETEEYLKELKENVLKNVKNLEEKEISATRDYVKWQVEYKKHNKVLEQSISSLQSQIKSLETAKEDAENDIALQKQIVENAKSLYSLESLRCKSFSSPTTLPKSAYTSYLSQLSSAINFLSN